MGCGAGCDTLWLRRSYVRTVPKGRLPRPPPQRPKPPTSMTIFLCMARDVSNDPRGKEDACGGVGAVPKVLTPSPRLAEGRRPRPRPHGPPHHPPQYWRTFAREQVAKRRLRTIAALFGPDLLGPGCVPPGLPGLRSIRQGSPFRPLTQCKVAAVLRCPPLAVLACCLHP